MSNLIKSVYFQMDQDDTRVINSDHQMVQFVPQLLQQQVFSDPETGDQKMEDGFQDGMNILNMDDVRREEREKMQQETSRKREELLEQARLEAQEIVQKAQEEAAQIREQAQEEGRNEGFEQGKAQADERLKEAALKLQQQIEQERQALKAQEEELEPKFAEIMAALIEKITGVICSDKKDVIVYLIHQALNQLDKTKSVCLRVSKADVLRISGRKEELRRCVSEGVDFDITEDDSLEENQCIIETDQRIIDCSLDVQLQNLKDQIKMLMIM